MYYLPSFCRLQLSDLDARVLDELLGDPTFMESLVQQGIKFEKDDEGGAIGGLGEEVGGVNNTSVDKPTKSTTSGLAKAGEWFPRERNSSYESATMKVVEELQDSVRGILAKMSAAIESAGEVGVPMLDLRSNELHATIPYIDELF